MLALAVCDCTPGGRTPDADIVPERVYEVPHAMDPVAETIAGVVEGAAGTRPTLVVVTAGGAPPVAGTTGGVAVTNETIGTVTAVVMTVIVEE